MVEGKLPWTGRTEYEIVHNIESKPLQFHHEHSKGVRDFLTKCLGVEEKDRFTWD